MMSLETEYSSGSITEEEAQARKKQVQMESDFYGSMDGASKFISGNVKIGIFITFINVLGGIIVGVVMHGEPLGAAVSNYIGFSIGDGLLSQFPALLISTATGIIVTRSVSIGTFGEDIASQFSRDFRIYLIGAVVLAGFALLALGLTGLVLPVLPAAPFFLAASFCFLKGSARLYRRLMAGRFPGPRIARIGAAGLAKKEKIFI
jgi:flagellar biosynthesis component FlhA